MANDDDDASSIDVDELNALLVSDSEETPQRNRRKRSLKTSSESRTRKQRPDAVTKTRGSVVATAKMKKRSDIKTMDDALFGGLLSDNVPVPKPKQAMKKIRDPEKAQRRKERRERKERKMRRKESRKKQDGIDDVSSASISISTSNLSESLSKEEALRSLMEEEEKTKSLIETVSSTRQSQQSNINAQRKEMGLLDNEDSKEEELVLTQTKAQPQKQLDLGLSENEDDNVDNDINKNSLETSIKSEKPKVKTRKMSTTSDDVFSDDDFLAALEDKSTKPLQTQTTLKSPSSDTPIMKIETTSMKSTYMPSVGSSSPRTDRSTPRRGRREPYVFGTPSSPIQQQPQTSNSISKSLNMMTQKNDTPLTPSQSLPEPTPQLSKPAINLPEDEHSKPKITTNKSPFQSVKEQSVIENKATSNTSPSHITATTMMFEASRAERDAAKISELSKILIEERAQHAREVAILHSNLAISEAELSRSRQKFTEAEISAHERVSAVRKQISDDTNAQLCQLKQQHEQAIKSLKTQHSEALSAQRKSHRSETESIVRQSAGATALDAISARVVDSANTLEELQSHVHEAQNKTTKQREMTLAEREAAIVDREQKLAESIKLNSTVIESFERMRNQYDMERAKVRDDDSRLASLHDMWVKESSALKDSIALDKDGIDEQRCELQRRQREWKAEMAIEQQSIERLRVSAHRKLAQASASETLTQRSQKNVQAVIDAESQSVQKDREMSTILRQQIDKEKSSLQAQGLALVRQKHEVHAKMNQITLMSQQIHSQAKVVSHMYTKSIIESKAAVKLRAEVELSWQRLRSKEARLTRHKLLIDDQLKQVELDRRNVLQCKETALRDERNVALREKRAQRQLSLTSKTSSMNHVSVCRMGEHASRSRSVKPSTRFNTIERKHTVRSSSTSRVRPSTPLSMQEESELYQMRLVAQNAKAYAEEQTDIIGGAVREMESYKMKTKKNQNLQSSNIDFNAPVRITSNA